jgi:hypothetical protein
MINIPLHLLRHLNCFYLLLLELMLLNCFKMAIFSKLILRFNLIPIRIPNALLCGY